MSILSKFRHTSPSRDRRSTFLRELNRAAAAAPTRASREELLMLKNMGR